VKSDRNIYWWQLFVLIGIGLFGSLHAAAQKMEPPLFVPKPSFTFQPPKPDYRVLWKQSVTSFNQPNPTKPVFSATNSIRPISPAAVKTHWGWFCHAEDRFRQTTKVPLYVRLGSVEQTNRLEGK
jgi:hypothetical protein